MGRRGSPDGRRGRRGSPDGTGLYQHLLLRNKPNFSPATTMINTNPSVGDTVKTFFWVHLVLSAPLVLFPFLIVPQTIYTFVKGDKSIKDGELNQDVANNFPLFDLLRRRIGLTVTTTPKFRDSESAPNAQFIFGFHPHGVGSDFRVLMQGILPTFLPNIWSRTRSLAATVLFKIPIIRQITLWTGCIDASRSVADRALKNGRSLIILPGGEAEQLMTVRGEETLYLERRKGFVKLALKHEIPLVPCYVFGSNDLFSTSRFMYSIRHTIMKTLGVCIPLAKGTAGSFVPFPIKNTVVIGDPIVLEPVADITNITSEELDNAHKIYMSKIRELFDANKSALGYGDRELKII